MSDFIFAVIGLVLVALLTWLFAAARPVSGDPVIQPEGEPDPGKH